MIGAIAIVLLLPVAAVCFVVCMERSPSFGNPLENNLAASAETTSAPETDPTAQTNVETVGITLLTEDPSEMTPEIPDDLEDMIPPVSQDPEITQDQDVTEDEDENATPELES